MEWVTGCINSPKFSILVNGATQGFFESTRGIRQGDPLSPFLFIIMAEALGRSISHIRAEGKWKGIEVAPGIDKSTHNQFANDTLLFGATTRVEARCIKKLLNEYGLASGQNINWHKSKVFFLNVQLSLQTDLARILELKIANFPGKFLGMPLFAGVNKLLGISTKQLQEETREPEG